MHIFFLHHPSMPLQLGCHRILVPSATLLSQPLKLSKTGKKYVGQIDWPCYLDNVRKYFSRSRSVVTPLVTTRIFILLPYQQQPEWFRKPDRDKRKQTILVKKYHELKRFWMDHSCHPTKDWLFSFRQLSQSQFHCLKSIPITFDSDWLVRMKKNIRSPSSASCYSFVPHHLMVVGDYIHLFV